MCIRDSSLGRRLVNPLAVAQRTNAFTNGVVDSLITMYGWMLSRDLGGGWKGAVMMNLERLGLTDVMLLTIMANDFCRLLPIAS